MCKCTCLEFMQKQSYLQALCPHSLATHQTNSLLDHTLQQVMAAAMQLELRFRGLSVTSPAADHKTPTTTNAPSATGGMPRMRSAAQLGTRGELRVTVGIVRGTVGGLPA